MAYAGATMRQTAQGETVGPKMTRAVRVLAEQGPLPSKKQLASRVGPHGSLDYGYRIVDRCISKGLISVEADHPDASPHGKGAVVVTDKGRQFVNRL